MTILNEEELNYFEEIQKNKPGERPAAVFLMSEDFLALLKKKLESDDEFCKILDGLDYFSSASENVCLFDEGWIEAKLEDGSEGVYAGVYFGVILEGKTCLRRIATIKTLNEGLSAYKQMGALVGGIIYMGNEILRQNYWKTINLYEIDRIEKLKEKGISFEDIVAEIRRRQAKEPVKKGEDGSNINNIYSIRVLLHLANLWYALDYQKSMLEDVKYLTKHPGNEKYVFTEKRALVNRFRLLE